MFKVNIVEANNFNESQKQKVITAMRLFEKTLNSSFFRNKIINFTYNGRNQFYYNQDMNNSQVYTKIISGSEILNPAIDYEADLYLNLDKSPRRGREVGYTDRRTNHIFTYESWFNDKPVYDYSGHIAHEWCHKLGFEHPQRASERRKYTVPYAIGYLVREISAAIFNELTTNKILNYEKD